MGFLLKIVEGPNKGAEIALVEGVSVTLGKGDDCDIVLADNTLPDEPLVIAAAADSVSVGGEPLEPLAVRTVGATSFAVGPADAPWGALKWPKTETAEKPETPEKPAEPEKPETQEEQETPAEPAKKRGGGWLLWLALLILLIVILLGIAWFFRDRLSESDRFEQFKKIGRDWYSRISRESRDARMSVNVKKASISEIAEKYGLAFAESNGVARVSGNFRTRRERLSATAEAYEAQPGVELDLSDDESFRAAADDALFTLTEGALKVVAATNRVVAVGGVSPSPASLKKTLEALNSDMPKIRGIDVSRVRTGVVPTSSDSEDSGIAGQSGVTPAVPRRVSKKTHAGLPVCGILTMPYPCLVMRDGRRIMEGATVGDGVIVKIEADSVTLTNSTGRFTWRP